MADKKDEQEFTVSDRRRFSYDGEVHDNPERNEESRETPEAAAPVTESKKAEVREFPRREQAEVAPTTPETTAEENVPQHLPLTADERKAGDEAFAKSSKEIDEQIRKQLGRGTQEFEMTFERFVASIYMTALMQMGLVHEQGGQPRVDLIGARSTIDTLAILRDKTKGNLTTTEDNLLNNSLYELQMAYVEVTNALTRSVQPAPPGAVPNPFVKK